MIVYHATVRESVPSILSRGLEPRIGPRSRELGEPRPAVYLFSDRATADDAGLAWLLDAFPENANLVLLEVDLPDDLPYEEQMAGEFVAYEAIEPSRIRVAVDPW